MSERLFMTNTLNNEDIVLFADNRHESGEPATAVGAQHGAATASVQPHGTAMALPFTMGAATSFAFGRF